MRFRKPNEYWNSYDMVKQSPHTKMKPNLSAYDPLRPVQVAYATLTRRSRKTRSECLTSPMTSNVCLSMSNIIV